MGIFFTADQHFHHANIIEYCKRPFSSVNEMNEQMIKRHNEIVQSEDIVYHLGDFSLSKKALTEILPRLHGEHHLIMGNHDHCHPAHHKNKEIKAKNARMLYLDAGFKTLSMTNVMTISNFDVILHHMPYQGDHAAERYTQYRPEDKGQWLLHGHVHDLWKLKGRMLNVGVDVWDFKPVSLDEVEKMIDGGK